jgi:SecD/SecF fusion protein
MEKRKPWQLYLILTVIILTLINILPTILYYSKPLKDPIANSDAHQASEQIADRLNTLEDDSILWLNSFTKHVGTTPEKIEVVKANPKLIELTFRQPLDATQFRKLLPQAGAKISFSPSQLSLSSEIGSDPQKSVVVERRVGVEIQENEVDSLFSFIPKKDAKDGIELVSPQYKNYTFDRVVEIAKSLAGESENSWSLRQVISKDQPNNERLSYLAKQIVEVDRTLGNDSSVAKRIYASFTQGNHSDPAASIQKFTAAIESEKQRLIKLEGDLQKEIEQLTAKNEFADPIKHQQLDFIGREKKNYEEAIRIISRNSALFAAGKKPMTSPAILAQLEKNHNPTKDSQSLFLADNNPYIKELEINWSTDQVRIVLHDDLTTILNTVHKDEFYAIQRDRLSQWLFNEIAKLNRSTDEKVVPSGKDYVVELNHLIGSSSLLVLDLGKLAEKQAAYLAHSLANSWTPSHQDLKKENYPLLDYASFRKLNGQASKLGLVIFAPTMEKGEIPEGFDPDSLYVIARGLKTIAQKYEGSNGSPDAQLFANDYRSLAQFLQSQGFIAFPGSVYGISTDFQNDLIFKLDRFYDQILLATRENFFVHGSKKFAALEFTDLEQRIRTLNTIETAIHEDLLKWRDQFNTAQVELDAVAKLLVPPPAKNVYWDNFKLSAKKYFRGDENRVLKWGLDLSGGKTVRIELRDQNNQLVTAETDLNQAVNELFTRINKMGVSEQTIRIEGSKILLEFPGSQAFSASELIKASAMYFNIVNEKFGPFNPDLASQTEQFLQEVWNEAVVTNRKDIEGIQQIAWDHLGMADDQGENFHPRTDAAKTLYENGLRLANPKQSRIDSRFDDSISMVSMRRGDEPAEWRGSHHPLLFTFANYALEGSSLEGVQPAYDPTKGNMLSFNVNSSYTNKPGNPRDDLLAWTSQFAEERIQGTPNERFSQGKGWRMAVILNGNVISDPHLVAPLREGGTISGNFSQREINRLVADLKAGSLSFTPKILSETNISPDLGQEERTKGIAASILGLVLVIGAMSGYYRFAGVIASVAVFFNILIMWGVLQNIGAALTLPGIAGIILTVGMAVDANVLVFERIREEFALSGRLASAVQAGYRKAFTAIFDSNITTIMAALILIQFDAGPVKGFATTLIIGIVSSMFTALFMSQYFFAGWVQNPNNKELHMRNWIGRRDFQFLSKARLFIFSSIAIMVIGAGFFIKERNTLFGMEFTGGYSLVTELEEQQNVENYRSLVADALVKAGAPAMDIQVKRLNKPNQVSIQIGDAMEQKGNPFYGMPEFESKENTTYDFETNPRLEWVVNALNKGGVKLKDSQFERLDQNWSAMSGQFSDAMRNNAIFAILSALVCILIYVSFRFEFKYGISAVIGLAHDLLITIGFIAILHAMGLPIQIDLEVIGAIMTIIGYSLNDTIIIFDRVREDSRLYNRLSFSELVERSLNVTLSRTMMTSGTTLLVLIALVLLGGSAIFAFSLVLTIGVIVGTLSSLFIASPILIYFHDREEQQAKQNAITHS